MKYVQFIIFIITTFLWHFNGKVRGLSEEERFEREKAERQRIAELLAEREKLLSRWARFVF